MIGTQNNGLQWVKVVYQENPQSIIVKQGYISDEGDFVKVHGDVSTTLIRKSSIISITSKLAGENHEYRHRS